MKRIHSSEINEATKAKLAKTDDDDSDDDDEEVNNCCGSEKHAIDENNGVDDHDNDEEEGEVDADDLNGGGDENGDDDEVPDSEDILEKNGIRDSQDYRRLLPSLPSSSSFTLVLPLRRNASADGLYCVYEPMRSLCHCSFNEKQRTISNNCNVPGLRVSARHQSEPVDYDQLLGSHKIIATESSSSRLATCCGNNTKWRLMHNENYELCKSLPSMFYVPMMASEELIKNALEFRHNSRIPVLTYEHNNGSALLRSSQPNMGKTLVKESMLPLTQYANQYVGYSIKSTGKNEDFELIKASGGGRQNFIIDLRSKENQSAQFLLGGGSEVQAWKQHLPDGWCFREHPIANIHAVQESFQSMQALWIKGDSDLQWLRLNIAILKSVEAILTELKEPRTTVLVHCTDGWDRTTQVCFLSQLCCCSYFRTIHGFVDLFEKEFLAFGHPMKTRFYGKDWSPILLQTFDCARIIHKQNQSEFEFPEEFILSLYEVIINCKLIMNFNCESERRDVTGDDTESSEELSDWKNAIDALIMRFPNKTNEEGKSSNGDHHPHHHPNHNNSHHKESFELLSFKYRLTMEVDPWHAAARYFLLWHSCGSPAKRKSEEKMTTLLEACVAPQWESSSTCIICEQNVVSWTSFFAGFMAESRCESLHHCRHCGAVVCNQCSSTIEVPHPFLSGDRVCSECYDALQMREYQRRQS
eukprot:TRINITY_DN12170_c0_g2_i1.p1 TRINITY_DN12170_c0_g2~~TRINITY_DN12170_c0_g2_i1.p1  ORF type:complete len:698 (+),score=150.68 TRINITY_DN12170_c0_g2_i1:373-2466(+)